MKTYRNDKSTRKHSDAAGSGPNGEATKAQESKHVQYSMRTRSSSQRDNTPEQNHDEPNIIKTLSQTAPRKKRSHRSSLAKIRKERCRSNSRVRSTSEKLSASSSGRYIRQRKRMDNSSDDEEVTIQTDSDSSGGSVENVNREKKKRGRSIVRDNGQNILSDASTPAKPSAAGRERYTRQRKRNGDSSDEEEISIRPDSDSADSSVGNIKKKKKKKGRDIVHQGHGRGIQKDGPTSAKPSASGSGKYIKQKRVDNSSDDEAASIQIDSASFDGAVKTISDDEAASIQIDSASFGVNVTTIKREKKKKGEHIVHSEDQDVLEDDSTSSKSNDSGSGNYLRQRKRKRSASDEEEASIQTDSDLFGGSAKSIKKKRRLNSEQNLEDVLAEYFTSLKSCSSDNGKYVRKRSEDSSDEEKVSIRVDSDSADGSEKIIKKKKKKRVRNIVRQGCGQGIQEDGPTSAKPSASGSGKYIKPSERNRMGNSSDYEAASIQIDSASFGVNVTTIKREKKKEGGEHIVNGEDQDVLEDDSTPSKANALGSGNYLWQRKRKRSASDEEEASIQPDSDLFGGSAKSIKKKRRLNSEKSLEDVLAEYFMSLKSCASDSGKHERKHSGDLSVGEETSIRADSDSADGSVENVKKKKRGENIVYGDGQNTSGNASTFVKPSASNSGKYIRQLMRSDDSSDGEEVSIQTDSYSANGSVKNLKKKKRGGSFLHDDTTSAKPGASGNENCIQQRKRSEYSSDEEEIIIKHPNLQTNIVNGDSRNILPDGTKREKFLSDFDFMRERKKAENAHRRKRNRGCDNYESESLIELLEQMKQAAIQDRQLNLDGKPATKKIAILHQVMKQLIKKDLQHTLLSHNVLHVLAEWIAPLPNKALPCLQIRESILKLLADFPTIDKFYLKESGIGKAVMYLYKHPSEIKANRERANLLITGWCRSVYNISANFSAMPLEERRQRDLQHLPKQPKPSTQAVVPSKAVDRSDFWLTDTNNNTIRPGEKGWISRARVPLPSNKVYIVRPHSNIETSPSIATKRQPNRYEMYLKKFNNNKRKNAVQSPVHLSIEGRKCCDY